MKKQTLNNKTKNISTKDKRILTILITALVIGIMAGVSLYFYLVPRKTTVYVFRDNYRAGQPVTSDILIPMQMDSKITIAGKKNNTNVMFVTGDNKEELVDKKKNTLRMDVGKGMPLTKSMLSIDGGSYIEMTMDENKIAVTVPVTPVSGVTDDLKAGSRVNIYSSGFNDNDARTTLLFQNMRILNVKKDSEGQLTAATIEVTPNESLKLIDAKNNSTISFGLVNGSAYQVEENESLKKITTKEE